MQIACLLALSVTISADGLGLDVYAPKYSSVDYYVSHYSYFFMKISTDRCMTIINNYYLQSYPSYAFEYAVRDPHTGDNKAQWEKRDGDVVTGRFEKFILIS